MLSTHFLVSKICSSSSFLLAPLSMSTFDELPNCTRLNECSRITSCGLSLLDKIDKAVLEGLKLCLILRGAPGRGKTTMARDIVAHAEERGLYKAEMMAGDDYMFDSSGKPS